MQRSYLRSLGRSFSTLWLYGCCIFYNACENNMQIKGGGENLTNKCRDPRPQACGLHLYAFSVVCEQSMVWKTLFNQPVNSATQHHILTVTSQSQFFMIRFLIQTMYAPWRDAFAYLNVCILQFSSIDKLILSLFLLLFSLSYFVVWNIFLLKLKNKAINET